MMLVNVCTVQADMSELGSALRLGDWSFWAH